MRCEESGEKKRFYTTEVTTGGLMRTKLGDLRPPGGKALVRLLQLLESAGYTEVANDRVRSALREEEDREQFWELATRLTPSLSSEVPNGGTPSSSPRDAYSHERATTDAAEDIARTYLEVGEQLAG